MKLSVEFPSVAYREGPQGIIKLAQAIEEIGFDQLDMFDHVVMGYPTDKRPAPMYPPKMPILEALTTLSFVASVTTTIGLGTEVLVLPQRQPVLVAKQFATLDTLSNGRVRLGVGVGWQESEYEALGEEFSNRGARMDEAIELLRAYWQDEKVNYQGQHYQSDAIAMEPKSPQAGNLPIWIGGNSKRALRRVGELGDGWMAVGAIDAENTTLAREKIAEHAIAKGRDPAAIGYQAMLAPPPTEAQGKAFYNDLDAVAKTVSDLAKLDFGWAAINATAIFQSGAKSLDAMIERLGMVHDRIRSVT